MQAKIEKDEESKEPITKNEQNEKWLRRYERNMCPADIYDDITYGQEDLVAPIWKFRSGWGEIPQPSLINPQKKLIFDLTMIPKLW